MAMTIKTEGLTEVSEMLTQLGKQAEDVAAGSLYDGAGIVADAFTQAVRNIQTAPFKYAPPGQTRLPSPEEKAALMGKSGIAKFDKNGSEVDTMIGISGAAGYADVNGKRKAVRMIARSINSGTSFMKKQPFLRKAFNQSRGRANSAIENGILSRLDQLGLD